MYIMRNINKISILETEVKIFSIIIFTHTHTHTHIFIYIKKFMNTQFVSFIFIAELVVVVVLVVKVWPLTS